MTTESIVRKATAEDRDGIWDMLHLLHEENGVFHISEPKLDYTLNRILHPEDIPEGDMGLRGFIGVIGPVKKIEGLIILTLGSFWYTDEAHLEELANFVHPEFRKSNHAKTLLAWSRHISDSVGIPLLIGIISNSRTVAKVRLYRRQLPEAGSFFLYNATTTAFNGKTEQD
jgi:hypothetical protein